jgi:hypothetical protein
MRAKVNRYIKQYFIDLKNTSSPFITNEKYALHKIQMSNSKMKDKLFMDEFIRVFHIEFRQYIPYVELALREGRPIHTYLDIVNI